MTDLCSSLEDSIWFAAILSSLKTNIFCQIKIIFPINEIQNNAEFIFIEKKKKKIKKKKISLIYWIDPCI